MRIIRFAACVCLCLPVLLCSLNFAQPNEPMPHQLLKELLDPNRASALTDPGTVTRFMQAVEAVGNTRELVAQTVADPALEVKGSVSGKLGWKGAEVEGELSADGGKIKVPVSPMHSVAINAGDRAIGVTHEYSVLSFGEGEDKRSCKVFTSIEAKYKNNDDMYAALPLPGLRHMQALTDRAMGRAPAEATTPDQAVGWDARASFEDNARAVFKTAAEEVKKNLGWVAPESIKVQSGVTYEGKNVDLSTSHVMKFDFTQPDKFFSSGVENSATIKKSWGGELAGIEGAVQAGLTFVMRSDGITEPISAERKALSEAIRTGEDAKAAQLFANSVLPGGMTDEDVKTLKQVREAGKEAFNLALDQVVNVADPIGGVRLHFNPGFRRAGVSATQFGLMLKQLTALRKQGVREFALQPAQTLSGLVRVPLDEALLTRDDLGLTRVTGYVREGSTISLVGLREEGRSPIPRDHLTVALAAIWRDNSAPFVSLDPDPRDFAGAQKVRTGGLPAGMESTEDAKTGTMKSTAFVKTMIDADYLMKRLDLGELKVSAGTYTSSLRLYETWPNPPDEVMNRMWLVPAGGAVGDVYEHRDASGEAVLYRAGVAVQTETLKRAGETLIGAGQSDPMAEAAAASLTANYDALAALPECADFFALQQVFDVSKLCALWRARGVKNALLDSIAALKPAQVEHKATYQGIGPIFVRGGKYHLSGGAVARSRLPASGLHELPALASIRAGGDSVELPTVINLAGRELSFVNAELLANGALADVLAGRYKQALEGANRAVENDPDNTGALAIRGLAHYAIGNAGAAQTDLAKAAAREPALQALRGHIEACTGRPKEALAACDAAEKAAPDDADLLGVCGWARIYAMDFEGAERVASRLLNLSAMQADGMSLRDTLWLIYRDTPEVAQRWVIQQRSMPLASRENIANARAMLMALDVEGAMDCLRKAYDAALENQAPATAHVFTREYCTYLLATAMKAAADQHQRLGDGEKAENLRDDAWALVVKLAREHPDWPSLDLVQCDLAGNRWTLDRAMKAYLAAGTKDPANDPIFGELAHALGRNGVMAVYGLSLLQNAGRYRHASDERDSMEDQVRELVKGIAAQLGDTPEAAALRRVAEYDRKGDRVAHMRLVLAEVAKFPKAWPDDIGRVIWLNHIMSMVLSELDGRSGLPEAEARKLVADLRAHFMRACRVNGMPEGLIKQTGVTYFGLLASMQEEMAADLRKDARLEAIKAAVRNPAVEPEQWRRDLDALVAQAAAAKAEGLSPFGVAFLADPMTANRLEDELLREAETDSWKLPEEQGTAERQRLTAMRERLKPKGKPRPLENLVELADKAGDEVELGAVTTMIDAMARASGMMSGMEDPEVARPAIEMQRAAGALRAQIKGRTFSGPRDWAAWRAKAKPVSASVAEGPTVAVPGAAAVPGPAKPADAEAAESGPNWPLIGIGGAGIVIVPILIAVAVRRRKLRGEPRNAE